MPIVSGLLDQTNPAMQSCLQLERLLILINEVVNLQKVLSELVSSNEIFSKPLAQAAT